MPALSIWSSGEVVLVRTANLPQSAQLDQRAQQDWTDTYVIEPVAIDYLMM
jgi:hypothetical protein